MRKGQVNFSSYLLYHAYWNSDFTSIQLLFITIFITLEKHITEINWYVLIMDIDKFFKKNVSTHNAIRPKKNDRKKYTL